MLGVVAFISAQDIPSNGNNVVFDDVLFAESHVFFVGQRLGLIVASSQACHRTKLQDLDPQLRNI